MVVARSPDRCGGYIQSEKWKTSRGPVKTLDRNPPEPAPGRPPDVASGNDWQAPLDRESDKRLFAELFPLGLTGPKATISGSGSINKPADQPP